MSKLTKIEDLAQDLWFQAAETRAMSRVCVEYFQDRAVDPLTLSGSEYVHVEMLARICARLASETYDMVEKIGDAICWADEKEEKDDADDQRQQDLPGSGRKKAIAA